MADNVTTQSSTLATIPASTKISTDEDATNGHVQRVKLAVSADGSSTHIGGDANGLQIQGAAADAAAVTGNPVLIGGDDGTNAVNVAVDSDGAVHVSDGGNTLTVDGTVTANLSATDNAVLDQIEVNTSYGDNTGGGVESGALRVTIANDSTGVLSVDDNGGSLTVDNGGTFATQATLQANDGVDIGDVDITSVVPGTGATNLGKAVDSAAGATDTGVPPLAVRDDSLSALTPIEGDYVPLRVNSTGALHVTGAGGGTQYNVDDASPTVVTMAGAVRDDTLTTLTEADGDATLLRVSSTGALHVTGGGGGTEYTDDTSTHATGSSVGNLMMAAATPTDGSVDANDIGAIAMSTDRRLHVDAQIVGQDADITIADGGNTITVDGTVTANLGATDNAVLDQIEVNTSYGDNTGGGVEAGALRVTIANDSTGLISVDDNGGSLTVDGTVTANLSATDNAVLDNIDTDTSNIQTAVELIDDAIVADDAAFTPATTKVMMAGFEFDDTTPDSVDEGDAGAARMSANRNVYTQIRDAAGSERGANVNASNQLEVNIGAQTADLTIADGGNSITVDGTVTANLGATDNAVLDQIEVNTSYGDNTGNGTAAGALRVTVASDTTGVLSVDDNGGSLTVDGTVTASNTAGDIAHDSADSGNPVKVGGKAKNFDGTAPGTAVAEDDRADFVTDVYGRQYVELTHPNYWSTSADYASAQTNATVKAAPGAGLKLYITDVIISNGATAGNITLLDGSGGTVLLELYPAVNGGMAMPFRTPIALTANTLLALTSTTVTTHSVTINGYIAP